MNVLLLKAWLAAEGPGLIGARLRTVRQHDERSILLDLAGEQGESTLFLSVLEEYPALAVITDEAELPTGQAPDSSFAKALNFHLAGYQLDAIAQEGFDRSVVFTFSTRDLYGQETVKRLRHELVGRASNAFLISERDMVTSIMKRVRQHQNRVRHIITGKPLPPPPPLGKFIAAGANVDNLADELAALAERDGVERTDSLERFFARRVAACDVKLWPEVEPLVPVEYDLAALLEFIAQLQRGELTAQLFALKAKGDANRLTLRLWEEARRKRGLKQRPADLARERTAIRLDQLLVQRALSERADEVEQLALEMLRHAAELDAGDKGGAYLSNWCEQHVDWADTVSLDKSVYDNAQELVHYAQRLRRGSGKISQLIATAQEELTRIDRGVKPGKPAQKKRAQSQDPLRAHQLRLKRAGVKYLRFVSTDGLHIVCGLNDKSKDGLLRMFGNGNNMWLHARDFAGSHVIVLNAGQDVPRNTLEEAALVAAYHSQGRSEGELEVSYLPVKHLRRPKGAKPGQVLKTSEKVIRVRPAQFESIKGKLHHGN